MVQSMYINWLQQSLECVNLENCDNVIGCDPEKMAESCQFNLAHKLKELKPF